MSKQAILTHDFLFELGCEELPAKSLLQLKNSLQNTFEAELNSARLDYGTVKSFATPRRLAILVQDLASCQQASSGKRVGPSYNVAYDKSGAPTLACLGFAKSCNIAVDELEIIENKKGKFVSAQVQQMGRASEEILPEVCKKAIAQLPIPKPMRWGDNSFSFIRPVHWLIALYGNTIVQSELFGLHAGQVTYGHRFHRPEKLFIKNANQYLEVLQQQGQVLADFSYRQKQITTQTAKLTPGGEAIYNQALLDEVTALVEWPVALRGEFAQDFLKLPDEVLITTLQNHQKYFPIKDANGKLSANFITISNIESKHPEKITHGNEKVIRARLQDAEFFYAADQKQPLASYAEKLNNIVFEEQLGSVAAKSDRCAELATNLAAQVQADAMSVKRAAKLCKCDLLTDMVGEFPELQGIMGGYYAANSGESETVAAAIKEHYLPRFANDKLPATAGGACVAIADRLDTIVSIVAVGKLPTGDKDPYALRRAANGLLRIVFEFNWQFDIKAWCDIALQQLPQALNNQQSSLQAASFIRERLRSWSQDAGFSTEAFNAVEQNGVWECLDFKARLEALTEFWNMPEAAELCAAHKRVNNILRKAELSTQIKLDPEKLQDPNAQALYTALSKNTGAQHDYISMLRDLAALKQPIDNFFDKVMVMCDDQSTRNNRLALLDLLHKRLSMVADISCLSNK